MSHEQYVGCVDEVSTRQLRKNADDVLDRVQAGERLTVTPAGRPIAELRPLPRRALDAATLLERWRHLPSIDPKRFRADNDDALDASL